MFSSAIKVKKKKLLKKLCDANFGHISGHLKIVFFLNAVFRPSKILSYAANPSFHVHEKKDHCLKSNQL